MLKTLLFQLLSLRIGDLDLFIVIFQAFTESKALPSGAAQEDRLWEALQQALSNSSEDEEIAIIIDGLDEMEGLKPAGKKVSEKLQGIAQNVAHLRLILFSQPLGVHAAKSMEIVELSIDNVYDDLQTIIQQGLSRNPLFSQPLAYMQRSLWRSWSCRSTMCTTTFRPSFNKGLSRNPHFAARDPAEQNSIFDGLLTICDGSMLFSSLFVAYLAQQKTPADFGKAYETLVTSPPQSVAELVQRLLGTVKPVSDSKTVLSFLVAAKRAPLY